MKATINQDKLLEIARTWHIKKRPSYRAFKCANCRRFLRRAWHHWLVSGGFNTPIHLCPRCHNNLSITYPTLVINLQNINFAFKKGIKEVLVHIVSDWDIKEKPHYKQFSCDYCKRFIYKAYHIFIKINRKISEVHLCRHCWHEIRSSVESRE